MHSTLRLLTLAILCLVPGFAQTPARTTDLGGGCGLSTLSLPNPFGLGQNIALQVMSPALNAPGLLGVSTPALAPSTVAPGCILHLNPVTTVILPFNTNAFGEASFPFSVPNDPSILGTTLILQAAVFSGTGPANGTDLTNALSARVGQPIFVLVAGDKVIDQSISSIDAAAALLGVNPSVLVNDNNPVTFGNPWMPWSTLGAGTIVRLPSGEVGGDGFAAIPATAPFALADFVRGVIPQSQLDPIPNVMPLSNIDLINLIGKTVICVVYDGSLSIGYMPLQGNLQGSRNGLFAFTVLEVTPPLLPESQSSTATMDLVVRIEAPLDFNTIEAIPLRNTPADTIQISTAEWQASPIPGQPGTLTIIADSSAVPLSNLFVTVEGFNFQVQMTRLPTQSESVFTAQSLVPLTGRRVTVSSSLGGSYNTTVN